MMIPDTIKNHIKLLNNNFYNLDPICGFDYYIYNEATSSLLYKFEIAEVHNEIISLAQGLLVGTEIRLSNLRLEMYKEYSKKDNTVTKHVLSFLEVIDYDTMILPGRRVGIKSMRLKHY